MTSSPFPAIIAQPFLLIFCPPNALVILSVAKNLWMPLIPLHPIQNDMGLCRIRMSLR
jgi:hypothetical protein